MRGDVDDIPGLREKLSADLVRRGGFRDQWRDVANLFESFGDGFGFRLRSSQRLETLHRRGSRIADDERPGLSAWRYDVFSKLGLQQLTNKARPHRRRPFLCLRI